MKCECDFDMGDIVVWPAHCICGRVWVSTTKYESRGLGDTIAKAAAKAGIKPCGGCKQRQDLLNRVIPYKKG